MHGFSYFVIVGKYNNGLSGFIFLISIDAVIVYIIHDEVILKGIFMIRSTPKELYNKSCGSSIMYNGG